MESAVAAPARFRLAGTRAGTAWPMVAAYLLVAALVGLLLWVAWLLDARLTAALPAIALGAATLALAWRTAARWRVVPALYVSTAGIAVEHPDLAERLVLRPEEIAYVVLSADPATAVLPRPRFPVEGGAGFLWSVTGRCSLALFGTAPIHRPTVAAVLRAPRDLPVRPLSEMRLPFAEYTAADSRGVLLSVRDVAGVRAALARAGIAHGAALPREHVPGLVVHPRA